MGASINVALPSIGREFSLSAVTLSWIITSYLLAVAIFLVPFGNAGDRYGRRNLFLAGAVFFTLASCAAALAPSVALLIGFRIIQGIGAAMIFATGTAMLTAAVPSDRRGSMLGLNVTSTYAGLSLGPTLGGILTGALGWRSVFYTTIPIGVIIVLFVYWKTAPEKAEKMQAPFDYKGSVLYCAALGSCMYGLNILPGIAGIALVGAGMLGIAFFARMESRIKAPVLSLELFRHNAIFTFSNLAALLNYSATAGAGFFMSLYLQYVKALPPKNAGLMMISQPLFMALFSPFAGKLSDRLEPRIVASSGMAITATSLFFFSRISEGTPFYLIIGMLMLLGTGVAFFSSPNTSAIMGSVDKPLYGMASSIVGTMRLAGSVLSMGIAATIISTVIGNVAITPVHHQTFIRGVRLSYFIFGLLCSLGVVASLSRGKVPKKTAQKNSGSTTDQLPIAE